MRRPSFVYVQYIATTPEKLWSALTDGSFTREYWGGRQVESDWQPGSPVLWRKQNSEVDEGLRQGWVAILSSLKTFLETGEALDISKRWAAEGR